MKKFMSYNGSAIYYGVVDGNIVYAVAKGDGTDKYFSSWEDAMDFIDSRKGDTK